MHRYPDWAEEYHNSLGLSTHKSGSDSDMIVHMGRSHPQSHFSLCAADPGQISVSSEMEQGLVLD